MTRRSKTWRVIAALFVLANVFGAGIAAATGEASHAVAHVGVVVVVALAWRFAPRSQRSDLSRAQVTEERLDYLQQSIDAIAIEVERIGEAQRFATKLLEQRAKASSGQPPT